MNNQLLDTHDKVILNLEQANALITLMKGYISQDNKPKEVFNTLYTNLSTLESMLSEVKQGCNEALAIGRG